MNEYTAHTEEYKGLKIKIIPDDDAQNPRTDQDNFGHMACSHRRYNLGDEPFNAYDSAESFFRTLAREADPGIEDKIDYWENDGWDKLHGTYDQKAEITAEKIGKLLSKVVDANYIVLPLYLYDHSGITIRTGPFNDPWDSGQVGFIYVSLAEVRKEHRVKRVTKTIREKATALLEGEVKEYDQYLTGDVYGVVISKIEYDEDGGETDDGEELDSCWGFYGKKYALEEAKSSADYFAVKLEKEKAEAEKAEAEKRRTCNYRQMVLENVTTV